MAAIFRGMGTHAHRNLSREIVIVNLSKTNLVCKNAVRVSCACFSWSPLFQQCDDSALIYITINAKEKHSCQK